MKYTPKELRRQLLGFVFNADDFLETVLPEGWNDKRLIFIKNNIIQETNLMAETQARMAAMGLTSKRAIKKTVREFAIKYGTGLANTDRSKKLPHGQNLLRNRVENDLLYRNAVSIEQRYKGRRFVWLPSGAKEPRHAHMLRYGKVFEVGNNDLPKDDDFPGKAYGCKCGYQWVDEPISQYDPKAEEDVGLKKKK